MEVPKFKVPDFDDKDLVILAVWSILLAAIFTLGKEALPILNSGMSGLFGVAVGKNLK
jgi:hypothetical protein